MKHESVAIWDTYVTKPDGSIVHFDIVVPKTTDEKQVQKYCAEAMAVKKITMKAKQCSFCHIDNNTEEWADSITKKGYHIILLSGF